MVPFVVESKCSQRAGAAGAGRQVVAVVAIGHSDTKAKVTKSLFCKTQGKVGSTYYNTGLFLCYGQSQREENILKERSQARYKKTENFIPALPSLAG